MTAERFDMRRARLNKGLSQRGLAAETGLNRETIRTLERGESVPHPATAKKVADYFGVEVIDLMPEERAA